MEGEQNLGHVSYGSFFVSPAWFPRQNTADGNNKRPQWLCHYRTVSCGEYGEKMQTRMHTHWSLMRFLCQQLHPLEATTTDELQGVWWLSNHDNTLMNTLKRYYCLFIYSFLFKTGKWAPTPIASASSRRRQWRWVNSSYRSHHKCIRIQWKTAWVIILFSCKQKFLFIKYNLFSYCKDK